MTSYENVLLASRGLLWAWGCVGVPGCVKTTRKCNSPLKKREGNWSRNASRNSFWDLTEDTRFSLCFKTRVQSYWYENDFVYARRRKLIFQLKDVLHLASLWKWDSFWSLQLAYFFENPRETEHPIQTLVFAKTAGHHYLVEVILFSQWGSREFSLFLSLYFHKLFPYAQEQHKIWKVQLSHDLLWEIKIYKLKRSSPTKNLHFLKLA